MDISIESCFIKTHMKKCYFSILFGLGFFLSNYLGAQPPPVSEQTELKLEDHLLSLIRENIPSPGQIGVFGPDRMETTNMAISIRERLNFYGELWTISFAANAKELEPKGKFSTVISMRGDVENWTKTKVPVIAVIRPQDLGGLTQNCYTVTAQFQLSPSTDELAYNTLKKRLEGNLFQMGAKERFQLLWDAHGKPGVQRPEFGEIVIHRIPQTRLFEISAVSHDPVAAAISANATAEAAEVFLESENRQLLLQITEDLKRVIEVQKAKTAAIDKKMLEYRQNLYEYELDENDPDYSKLLRDHRVSEAILNSLMARLKD
jgi:hypothetical protein